MTKLDTKNSKKLIYLCSLAYFVSYLTRINFAAVIAAIISDGYIDKTAAGAVTTVGFITYGVGQLISGKLGDRFDPKRLMTLGFAATALMNLAIPFARGAVLMCIVWGVNGLAQSLMWPPMLKIMKTAMSEDDFNKGCVRTNLGSTIATIVIYVLSPAVISVWNWKGVFFITAVCGAVMAVTWFSVLTKIEKSADIKYTLVKSKQVKTKRSLAMPVGLLIFTLAAIFFQGILRDGVTTWLPTYICESFGLSSEKSILTSAVIPAFSYLSLQLCSVFYNKTGKKPYRCALLIFAVGAVAAIMLVVFGSHSVILTALMSALIVACMHGVNLVLISFIPGIYGNNENVSALSGTLNFMTYVGSAAASYGFALLSDSFGWSGTVVSWIVIALLGTGAVAVCKVISKEKHDER